MFKTPRTFPLELEPGLSVSISYYFTPAYKSRDPLLDDEPEEFDFVSYKMEEGTEAELAAYLEAEGGVTLEDVAQIEFFRQLEESRAAAAEAAEEWNLY